MKLAEQLLRRWHCNPLQVNDQKLTELAQRSGFSQLRLEQTQTHLSLTEMLRLFSVDSHAIWNIPWPGPWPGQLHSSPSAIDPHIKSSTASHVSLRLITCDEQFYPQGSQRATLIGLSAATRVWVAEIGANQVRKVLRPAGHIK